MLHPAGDRVDLFAGDETARDAALVRDDGER
jgi:hypothetical protein